MLCSLFFFGPYPIVCQKIGLVISSQDFDGENPAVAAKFKTSLIATSSLILTPRPSERRGQRETKSLASGGQGL